MINMKSVKVPVLLLLTLAFAAVSAQAILLPPGSSGAPAGLAVPAGEVQVATTGIVPWIAPGAGGSGSADGTLQAAVYRNSSGFLDFVYQFINDPLSSAGISSTTGLSFAGFSTNVDYFTNGSALGGGFVNGTPGVFPGAVFRTALGGGSVVTYGFNVPNDNFDVNPGQTSAALVVRTDAVNFKQGTLGIIAGGTFTDVNVFGPASLVPEPTIFLPIGVGLFAFALLRRQARA
jgi:hypothetical protein